MDNINEWTSLPMPELLTRASCQKVWKSISAKSSLTSPRRSSQSKDCAEHCERRGFKPSVEPSVLAIHDSGIRIAFAPNTHGTSRSAGRPQRQRNRKYEETDK